MNRAVNVVAAAAAGLAAVALVLSGCSASPTSSATSSKDAEPTSIVVGTPGLLSNADVYAGVSDGLFSDVGLDVSTQTLTAGSNAVPQLLSGDLAFAIVDTTSAVSAAAQDIGIVAVATNIVGSPGEVGYGMVVAGADSGITSPKDLEGKKVQVNQLGGTAQVLVMASVSKDGGDPSALQFVEMAPDQAIPALQSGQLDAIVTGEPLVTMATQLGFTPVFNLEQHTVPNLPTFVFVTSEAFATAHPDVVEHFQSAILASNAKLNADPDLLRSVAVDSTGVSADVLAEVAGLPLFGEAPLTADDIQQYIDFLTKWGALDTAEVPAGADVVWSGR